MQNLEMESGPKFFKYGILAVIAIVFGVAAFSLTRTNNPSGEIADASSAPGSEQTAAPANDPVAPQATAAADVAAESNTPIAPAVPETQPAMAATSASASEAIPAESQPGDAEPATTAVAAPVAAQVAVTEPAISEMNANEPVDSKVASLEPAKKPKYSAPKQPVTSPRPAALDALQSWWSPSAASPFKVEYVGQLVDKNSLVILFSGPVQDTAAASEHIRVLAEDGSPVNTNWQTGGTDRMIVQNDLEPGRYTVMIDPAVSNAQGQALGSTLSGPVYIQ